MYTLHIFHPTTLVVLAHYRGLTLAELAQTRTLAERHGWIVRSQPEVA